MKKALPLTLVLIGTALLITAVVFWIDSNTSTEPQSFGKTLLDWATLIAGLGVSIKGWIDLFKKEKQAPPINKVEVDGNDLQTSLGNNSPNIKIGTFIKTQIIQQPIEPRKVSTPLNITSVDESKRTILNNSWKRYLDALDSARFARSSNEEKEKQIHLLTLLYAKAQLILALAFGDTIVITENQLFDSEGFIEAFDEFYNAAQEVSADIDLPIKVAKLNEGESMYEVVAKKLNNEKFVLALWRNLDRDFPRRKLWANSFSQKQMPTENVSIEETIYLNKLWTALEYFTPERSLIAKRTGSMFGDLIKRIINLSDGDLEDLHTGLHTGFAKYFVRQEEADAAIEIRDVLRSIEDKAKEIKDRSTIITPELDNYHQELKDGVIALTNAIYNYTNGIGTRATLVQSSMFFQSAHKYISAGYSLATYLQETHLNPEYSPKWGIYSTDFFGNIEVINDKRRANDFIALIESALKTAPWKGMVEAQSQPKWLTSLQKFRQTLLQLQLVQKRISIGYQNTEETKELEFKRDQLEKLLYENWTEHINNIADVAANGVWKITPTKIVFSHPQIDFAIYLSYSFLKTRSYMAQDEYEFWRNKDSFKGRLDERIDVP